MKVFALRSLRLHLGVAALLAVGLTTLALAQQTINVGGTQITGVPDDWSHHHLVFSDPGTEDEAIRNGTHEEWLRVVNDPRYIIQQLKRHAPARGPAAEDVARIEEAARANGTAEIQGSSAEIESLNAAPARNRRIKKDWGEGLNNGTVNPNTTPSSFTNISGANCSTDFVIYPTGSTSSTSQASIIAYNNLYSGCSGTVPKTYWAYNTGGNTLSSPVFSEDGTQVAFVQVTGTTASLVLLKWNPSSTSRTVTGSLSTVSPNVTLTSGAFTQADVGVRIAGTNIPTGDTILTVLSSTTANLAVAPSANHAAETLTITAEALATPGVAPTVSNAAYPGCTAPCMTTVTLSGSPNDTWSSPYPDYGTDSMYVGDATGKLQKFTTVFTGTPALAGSPWPVQLKHGATNDTNQANSPVYDSSTGHVFVGTVGPAPTTGGYLYSVTNSGTIFGASNQLDTEYGIRDAPLVDSTAQRVYAFAGLDPSGNTGVFQFPTSFTSGSGAEATTGVAGGTGVNAYQMEGTFDNIYYSSSNSSSPSGNLYLCSTGAPATLYQVAINGNTFGTVTSETTLGDTLLYGRCSPLTEFFNTSLPISATGTITISSNPAGWTSGSKTVTVGGTTYTFVTTLGAANTVLMYTASGTAGTNESRTAENLHAAIDAVSTECFVSPCFGTGTVANPSVTHPTGRATNVVSLTAATSGSGGDFTVSTNSSSITVSGGNNGSDGTDYVFLSVLEGVLTGCTDDGNTGLNGCVASFKVTNPAAIALSGALNLSSPGGVLHAPTGGFVVDNAVNSPAGTSNIYFLSTDNSGAACSTAGTGVCATQVSQTAP